MIKLKTILNEIQNSDQPDKSLNLYILKNKVRIFNGTLYHGTPMEGLKSIITNGIWGTQHGEIAEYDTFSTSINSQVLTLFSEGDGKTGLEFDLRKISVVVLDDILHKLMIELPGSGMEINVNEPSFLEFCNEFSVPRQRRGRYEYYLPYGYLSSLGVDAFTFDYVWKHIEQNNPPTHNDETEIAFLPNGMKKLNNMVNIIWVDGQNFDIEEKLNALAAIEEYA